MKHGHHAGEEQLMSIPDPQEELRKGREAALEFLPILKDKLISSDGVLHTGTMLSASAWLTGTSLYRSFDFEENSPPGKTIKSDEINKEWESLMHLFEEYNFQEANFPIKKLIRAAQAAPDTLKPKVKMLYVQEHLQDQYNTIMKKHGFDYLDGAGQASSFVRSSFNNTVSPIRSWIPT
jgi:hypothetical protein